MMFGRLVSAACETASGAISRAGESRRNGSRSDRQKKFIT
jgi:hypothetical protein